MADPIQFCGSNKTLKPAPGTEDTVRPLFVHSNGRENISCWKLTPEELALVAETGEVWFTTRSGETHYPIYISGLPLMEAYDMDTGETTRYHTDGRHVVNDAKFFALLHHGEQKYGDKPYGYHLGKVVQVLTDFQAPWQLLAGGWGHDLEEDCWEDLPMEDRREIVRNRFSTTVESIIWACTGVMYIDGVKQNRAARNAQIYAKIAALPLAAPVKCADRIANEEECVLTKSSMGNVYIDEAIDFDDKVSIYCPVEMRLRHLRAALAIHDYVGDTKKTTRLDLEARIAAIILTTEPVQ